MDNNVAELLTKALTYQKHDGHTTSMSMCVKGMGDWH